ncbi:MAG: DUF116 domain-containing protein [Desulfobulbaceae bacterium]|nr:DUF116 domain-containing protein [Desulfobulbaceae bacterium]
MSYLIPAWIALPFLVFFYKPVVRFFPKIDRDSYVRKVVAVGNRYFHKKFSGIPYRQRVLFLPYCLRAEGCPTVIDPELGLICSEDCPVACRLGQIKRMAMGLGYQAVFIVVSGRMHKKEGVLRSKDFLVRMVELYRPRGVIGCLCSRDLREKYLCRKNVSSKGALNGHGLNVIPQVCLLLNSNCRRSDVDWPGLEQLIKLQA